MKITDTQLVERATPKGGLNFICDSGMGLEYDYKLIAYCENRGIYGTFSFTVSIYFDDIMSDELYNALKECLGDALFSDMENLRTKSYALALSPTQRTLCGKFVDYINNHTTSQARVATYVFRIRYIKEKTYID